MQLSLEQKDIHKFLMIGDKVLIKPKNPQSQTKTGLYLPPSVQEKEKIQVGYIIKVGPGYPLPAQTRKVTWLFICRMPLTRSILMKKSI